MIDHTFNIPMPNWIIPRKGWIYAGWISRDHYAAVLNDLISHALKSDHGELREVEYYPKGIACWWKEPTK